MKKFLATAAALVVMAGAAYADPLEGIWQTEVDDGSYAYVTIEPCAENYCGYISRTFNTEGEYQSDNIGKMMVIDMHPDGSGKYKGSVWRPSNDKIYIGKIDLDGDTVRLRGCVAGGLICASQTWTRVQ